MNKAEKLAMIWKKTHKDYKGQTGGVKEIMVLRDGGTQIVALDSLTDKEIAQHLPTKVLEAIAYEIASKATANHTVPILKLDSIFKAAKTALLTGASDEDALAKTIAYVETIAVAT